MLYLKSTFTVPAASSGTFTACEACVYGTGEHADHCTLGHTAIEHQPVYGDWGVHELDQSKMWYRPARSGIYPLFDPPAPGLIHKFCEVHDQWEWVRA